ncbi:diacylglycerol/polyprenol kinase family protein [Rubritalea spongiae]|uniref:Diacylglycerol/polyprenol kinase family protein n=1 Tax=Rubritalea spongiae TaxID=430797 RepID=A0ABW5E4Z8_9BACT
MLDLLYIFLVIAALATVMLIASVAVSKRKVSAEVGRKSVHAGMGLLCMLFPLLFDETTPVVILAILAVISLVYIKFSKLKNTLGTSIFSVDRLSLGELIFPLAVAWIFTLANGKWTLYVISLLLLTLADTVGAIAGSKFGKKHYTTIAGNKTVEGSIAFFLTSVLCISIPLLLFEHLPFTSVIVLACAVGLFTTAVEGASGNGIDNLLIPVGSFLLLDSYQNLAGEMLVFRIILLLAILTVLLYTKKLHTFDGGAILTVLLYAFAATTLGGIPCLLACLLVLTHHILLQYKMCSTLVATHSLSIIIAIAIPTLLWLTLGIRNIYDPSSAQLGFILSLSIAISMLHAGTQKFLNAPTASLLKGGLLSLLVMLPILLVYPIEKLPSQPIAVSLMLTPLFSRLYYSWKASNNDQDPLYWLKFCLLLLTASTPLFFILS